MSVRVDMAEMIERYCLMRGDGSPYCVYGNKLSYSACMVCNPSDEVYRIKCVECDEDSPEGYQLVGWRYFGGPKDGQVSLIYPSKHQIALALGGSYEPSVERGLGELVFMRVVEAASVGAAKDLK